MSGVQLLNLSIKGGWADLDRLEWQDECVLNHSSDTKFDSNLATHHGRSKLSLRRAHSDQFVQG